MRDVIPPWVGFYVPEIPHSIMQTHIFYSGFVQGIGFRYTVQRFALHRGLKGWARNLKDGRVEILVEGPPQAVEQFLKSVEKHFEANITGKEETPEGPESRLSDFRILQ